MIKSYSRVQEKGVYTQQIDIYYNCVGMIELPNTPRAQQKKIAIETREGVVIQLANEEEAETRKK